MYITGSRADVSPPRPSGVASSHGGCDVEAGLADAAVGCQGCQSPVPAVRPFSWLASPPFPSGHGGLDACAGPAGLSVPSPSTQPSCSQGGRSRVRVVLPGPAALPRADVLPGAVVLPGSAASAVVAAAASAVVAAVMALAVGAAARCGAEATGGSQPGTESPA